MTIKLIELRRLIDKNIEDFLNNKNWLEFLNSSAYNYKYNIANQIAIYAQNPNATTCATYDFWQNQNRYVRKNSRSIGILDNTNRIGIKRIFDITQTGQMNALPENQITWDIKELDIQNYFQTSEYHDFLKEIILEDIPDINKPNLDNVNEFIIDSIIYRVSIRLGIEDIDKMNLENLKVPDIGKDDFIITMNEISQISRPIIDKFRKEIKIIREVKRDDNNPIRKRDNSNDLRWERRDNLFRPSRDNSLDDRRRIDGEATSGASSDGRVRRSEQLLRHQRTSRDDGKDSNQTIERERRLFEDIPQSPLGRDENQLPSGQINILRSNRRDRRGEDTGRENVVLSTGSILQGQTIDRKLHDDETSTGLDRNRRTQNDESMGADRRIESDKSSEVQKIDEQPFKLSTRNYNISSSREITTKEDRLNRITSKMEGSLLDRYDTDKKEKEANNTQASFFNFTDLTSSNSVITNDPLNHDLDGDGVIDRYDADPRDSMVQSIGDLEEREKKTNTTEIEITDESNENIDLTTKVRFQKNIEAIGLLKELEKSDELATENQKQILKGYTGWGSIPEAFDPNNSSWKREYRLLKNTLRNDEYQLASKSILNSFYTEDVVTKSMYEIISNFGMEKAIILEPSMGIGNFLDNIPNNINGKFFGVELDSITGRIAQKIYPDATVYVKGFEETNFKDNTFDLAIGNIPFGNYKVFDKDYVKENFMIHDYFIAKSLDKVRDGGIVAFITSKGTMDKKDSSFREYIAKNADLVGAIRLPNNAFMGTSVTSDILFFQKNSKKDIIKNEQWLNVGIDSKGLSYNQYFIDNPQFILGDLKEVSGRFGPEIACLPKEEKLKDLLENIVKEFPKDIYKDSEIEVEIAPINLDIEKIEKFNYGLINDEIYYRDNDELEPIKSNDDKALKEMIIMRDELRTLYDLQINNFDDISIENQQNLLNDIYDNFVEKYGYINKKENINLFNRDDSIALLKSLEIFTDKEFIRKADVFTQRVINPNINPENVDNTIDALIMSVNNKARVDLEYISNLCNKTIEEVELELLNNKEIFLNPSTNIYETKDEYLSGDVKRKLEICKEKLDKGKRDLYRLDTSLVAQETAMKYENELKGLQVNIEELEKVIPKDIEADDISFRLGSTWIPSKYIEQFISDKLNIYYSEVKFSPEATKWYIEDKNIRNVTTTVKYGTEDLNALHILERTLNLNERIRIYDKYIDYDGKEKRILNKDKTIAVGEKQELLKQEFSNWLFKEPNRRNDLVRIYNDKYNFIRPREYSGDNIQFTGINSDIELKKHQKDVIARSIFGGNTLMAHAVGAGKTYSAISVAMESKRLGLANKTLIAVPNHLTEQWGADFQKLYPNSNVLVATKSDFTKIKRQEFFGKIANGNYDAVIIGHSQLIKIPMSKEFEQKYIQDEIDELREKLESMNDTYYQRNQNKYSIKQIKLMEEKLETKLKSLMEKPVKDDNLVDFEELGIDKIIIDEAHEFKNLQINTTLTGISGISTSASQKAFDLYMKCRYMDEKTNGKGIAFLTGTPVSNSMAELFVMQKYLQHNLLKDKGLSNFDAWASNFGDITNSLELNVEGNSYQMKTKFSRFNNIPELMAMFKENADIKMAKDLDLPVPEMESQVIEIEASFIQKDIIKTFGDRADQVRAGLDSKIDNLLKITSDGRKLSIDQRTYNQDLPDEDISKVNTCVDNVLKIYRDTKEDKLTQLIFCDLSTPNKDKEKFNIYDDMKIKLIYKGVEENEIAFIHDAKNEEQKEALFEKVREGDIRILLGSTQMMGTGTNVQKKLVALHHYDAPWRPADLEQRTGRMLRRGNGNKKVYEFNYITKGTFDAYMYQTLENKQRFISQIMSGDTSIRVAEDIDETVLKYSEIKALCTDNPLIKEKMELENDINRMSIEKSSHLNSRIKLERMIDKEFPETIKNLKSNIVNLEKDIKSTKTYDNNSFSIVIDGKTYENKKEAGEALRGLIKKYGQTDLSVGQYKNYDLYINYSSDFTKTEVTLKDNNKYVIELGQSEEGNMQRIENKVNSLEDMLERQKDKLTQTETQLEIAKVEYDEPYRYEEEYREKLQRLKEINLNIELEGTEEYVSIQSAKEVLISKSLEINGYSDLNFADLNNIKFISRENFDDKIEIVVNLEEPTLLTYVNDTLVDRKEFQNINDLTEFELKNFGLKDVINKLIVEEIISEKDAFLDMLLNKTEENTENVKEQELENKDATEYAL